MKKLATNKDREANLKRKIAKIPENAEAGDTLAEFYTNFFNLKEQQELDPNWAKNNLEYDLRACDYIVEKCKDEYYAQNIYAAFYNLRKEKFVTESYVTDEVKEDLFKLGWVVLEQDEEQI